MLSGDEQGKSYDYWVSLSIEERDQILIEGNFWKGFSTYFWQYLPDPLKEYLVAKSTS